MTQSDGWHIYHVCGGRNREITRINKGEAFMCVACGEWFRASRYAETSDLASEYGALLAERDRLIEAGADPDELLVPDPPPA